jgi:hypothetical protein
MSKGLKVHEVIAAWSADKLPKGSHATISVESARKLIKDLQRAGDRRAGGTVLDDEAVDSAKFAGDTAERHHPGEGGA